MPESASYEPFRSVAREPSLSDKVQNQLTEAIVSKRLKPGELLPSERELGDKFKVSRTVIREAVRSLAAKGLVRVTSGRGVEVNGMTSGNVADSMRLLVRGHESLDYGKVHEVRAAMEVQTAWLAAQRASRSDVLRLEKICDDHEAALKEKNLHSAGELDFQFHRELTRASGNELLLAMLDSISDVLREVRYQSMARPHVGEEGLKAHRAILKAISNGKPDLAREAMATHLEEAERIWRGGAQKAAAKGKKKKAR
jgi:GntR family transcriptional repressor for pyruvate dehydrogenase complex